MRAWILPDGAIEMLPDHESHGVAVMRLQTDSEFRPLDAGWVRVSGDTIQTGSLKNPRLALAFAVFARGSKGPAMVSHPKGNIEVPLHLAETFLENARAGLY
jgi:hypothetical protein